MRSTRPVVIRIPLIGVRKVYLRRGSDTTEETISRSGSAADFPSLPQLIACHSMRKTSTTVVSEMRTSRNEGTSTLTEYVMNFLTESDANCLNLGLAESNQ